MLAENRELLNEPAGQHMKKRVLRIYKEIESESTLKKGSRRMPGGLCSWTTKAFEVNTFSATLKPNISLDGTTREKATQINQGVISDKAPH